MTTAAIAETPTIGNVAGRSDDISELLAKARELGSEDHVRDFTRNARGVFFDNDLLMVPGNDLFAEYLGDTPAMPLTKHAWFTIASKLGPAIWGKGSTKAAPVSYWHAEAAFGNGNVMAAAANAALGRSEGKWLIRSYDGNIRAVLDHRYPLVFNVEVLDMLAAVIAEKRSELPDIHLLHPFVSADKLFIKVAWSGVNTKRGAFKVFTLITNDEIGTTRLAVLPGFQNTSCENSTIFNYEYNGQAKPTRMDDILADSEDEEDWGGIALTHAIGGEARKKYMLHTLAEALKKSFKATGEMIQRQIESYEVDLSDLNFAAAIDAICKTHGWSKDTSDAIKVANDNGGGHTLGGLVDRITWTAHEVKDYEATLAMEMVAGSVLLGGRRGVEGYLAAQRR